MNGDKPILDSNLIIFFSKGRIDLTKLRSKYDRFYVSIITYMEVYAYEFTVKTEKDLIDEFFDSLKVVKINKEIADQAIIYRKKTQQKDKTSRRDNSHFRQIRQRRFTIG